MSFRVFIDESGEAGISRVRDGASPGASPYMVLSAVVVQPAAEIEVRRAVEQFRSEIGRKNWKHATELNHSQKVFFCRLVSKLPVRLFGLISRKDTLAEYRDQIDSDPQLYYNKCAQYLLEKVFAYLLPQISQPEHVSIVFERRNHDYDRMIRFLGKVKENPFYSESKVLRLLNPFSIIAVPKGEEDILEVADLVAHGLFQCANKSSSNFSIPEYRYFEEFQSRFGADERGVILNTGLKCIHSLEKIGLDKNIEEKFRRARAVPRPK